MNCEEMKVFCQGRKGQVWLILKVMFNVRKVQCGPIFIYLRSGNAMTNVCVKHIYKVRYDLQFISGHLTFANIERKHSNRLQLDLISHLIYFIRG